MKEIKTGYDLVKSELFKETLYLEDTLEKGGDHIDCTSFASSIYSLKRVMERAALLDEYEEWKESRIKEVNKTAI